MINAFIKLFLPFGLIFSNGCDGNNYRDGFIFLSVSGKSTAGASSGQDSSSAFAGRNFVPAVVAKAKNLV
jgi:hypothetical protein